MLDVLREKNISLMNRVERHAFDIRRPVSIPRIDADNQTIAANLRRHGNFAVAMNNVRLYKPRFYPVRRRSPKR